MSPLWKLALVLFASMLIHATCALAKAPEGADPLSPTSQWFKSLKDNRGISCCSESDCRPVQAQRSLDGVWSVLIEKSMWPSVKPDYWLSVPENKVIYPSTNPVGAVLCAYAGGSDIHDRDDTLYIYCFTPPPEF